MVDNPSNNSTIAKNTVFLYIRMFFTMLVNLYTSRVILQVLGVDDYGLYQTVGGIVGFLSFLNGALSTGTSRFLTFELGNGNFERLKKTFSTTLSVHILIAIIVVIIAESAGLWFVYNKLVIPPERFIAALYAYHISIFTSVFTLILVPYNAAIIAHEKMTAFAYIGIVEVVCKLGVVYMLNFGGVDKLILYSILLFFVQLGLFIFYKLYCVRHFDETKYKFGIDKNIFKEVFSFSGWSLFAGGATVLNNQGIIVLINLFFSSPVVVARSISLQVNSAANQFMNNFRTAVNPQIVKRFAIGDLNGSKHLLLESTKFSYYLMLVLCLPICLLAYPVLRVWLVQVPEYSVIFLRLILVQSLFQVFDTSFYTALYAEGRLKENALISPALGFLMFPLVYVLFRLGSSPVSLSWVFLAYYAFLGLFIKPFLIVKIAHYTWREILDVFKPCLLVTLASVPLPTFLYFILDSNHNIVHSIVLLFVSLIAVMIAVWFVGMTENMKMKVIEFINKVFKKKRIVK